MMLWAALTVVWAGLEGWRSPRQRGPSAHAAFSGSSLLLLTLWGLMHGDGTAWGCVPFAVGVGLRLAAIEALGQRFLHGVELLPGHALERGGLYRWMRHPSEVGLLLIALGTGLMLGTPWAWLLMLPSTLVRVRAEERLLYQLSP